MKNTLHIKSCLLTCWFSSSQPVKILQTKHTSSPHSNFKSTYPQNLMDKGLHFDCPRSHSAPHGQRSALQLPMATFSTSWTKVCILITQGHIVQCKDKGLHFDCPRPHWAEYTSVCDLHKSLTNHNILLMSIKMQSPTVEFGCSKPKIYCL